MKRNTYFDQILNYCEQEKGYKVTYNRRANVLNMKFHMKWISLDVMVSVLEKKNAIVFNTVIPVVCREGNEDYLKIKIHDCNVEKPGGGGHFVYAENRVTYVLVHLCDEEQELSHDMIERCLDSCVLIPYMKAKEIVKAATEPVLLPHPPFKPFWMMEEEDEEEFPDDSLKSWPFRTTCDEEEYEEEQDDDDENEGWLW